MQNCLNLRIGNLQELHHLIQTTVLMLLCLCMHISCADSNNRRSSVVNSCTLTIAALAKRFRQQLHIPFAQRFQAHAVRHKHFYITSALIGHEFQQSVEQRRILRKLCLLAIDIHITRTAQKLFDISAQGSHRYESRVSHNAEASANALLDVKALPAKFFRQLQKRRIFHWSL